MKMNHPAVQTVIIPNRVIGIRNLTEASYVVRFERNGLIFKPGQHLVVGLTGLDEAREYSVYSGIHDEFLEILVRKVDKGILSHKLSEVIPRDSLEVNGPFGFFMANAQPPGSKKLLFIASGTGIAPFHSFIRSFPDADYFILHGIRTIDETYDHEVYGRDRYISCTSRDNNGDYPGRLTGYLKEMDISEDVTVYFCGNSKMIFDSIDILHNRGIPNTRIFTEVYF
jgi:ferredoxin--NADP+ reductase/benzoate/toluate 1,2-dioxygenase reductase subunit